MNTPTIISNNLVSGFIYQENANLEEPVHQGEPVHQEEPVHQVEPEQPVEPAYQDKIIMSSVGEVMLGITPKKHTLSTLDNVLDRISSVIFKSHFSSKRMGVDEYSEQYYNCEDSDENNDSSLSYNIIYGCETFLLNPGGSIIYHPSNQVLFDYTNIEFMLLHKSIPIQYTNLSTSSVHNIKRSSGEIHSAIIKKQESIKISSTRDKIVVMMHFPLEPIEEKEEKMNFGYYDMEKSILFNDFMDINQCCSPFIITIPEYVKEKDYQIDHIPKSVLQQLNDYYQKKIHEHLKLYQPYFDKIAISSSIDGNQLIVNF